jgi:hypothetical protein
VTKGQLATACLPNPAAIIAIVPRQMSTIKNVCNLFVTLPNKSCRNSTRGIRGRSISLNDGQVRDGYFVYKLSRGY